MCYPLERLWLGIATVTVTVRTGDHFASRTVHKRRDARCAMRDRCTHSISASTRHEATACRSLANRYRYSPPMTHSQKQHGLPLGSAEAQPCGTKLCHDASRKAMLIIVQHLTNDWAELCSRRVRMLRTRPSPAAHAAGYRCDIRLPLCVSTLPQNSTRHIT